MRNPHSLFKKNEPNTIININRQNKSSHLDSISDEESTVIKEPSKYAN